MYNSAGFYTSPAGNLCIRARIDSDGALSVDNSSNIPQTFKINNPYPNPFNPSVSLSYTLSIPTNITIAIYDIQGRLVDVLIDGFYSPGEYEHTWNAKDNSTGLYFVEYQIEKQSLTQKIALIK